MKKNCKRLMFGVSVALLLLADVAPQLPLGVSLIPEAAAIVGAPLTPVSYAGVARRTTRRVVAVEATAATAAAASAQQAAAAQQQQALAQQQAATTQKQQAETTRPAGAPPIGSVITALPTGCVSAPKDGIEYFNCGGVFYRTAFQGNNLVYVAQ